MTEIMVGACSELADGDYRIVAVGELEVGIFRLGDRFVAYENRCPHHGGPVCQGKLFNRVEEIIMPDQTSRGLRFSKDRHVVCPWHGYEFDLDTGRHPGDPRVRLRPIPVRVVDDGIYIDAPGLTSALAAKRRAGARSRQDVVLLARHRERHGGVDRASVCRPEQHRLARRIIAAVGVSESAALDVRWAKYGPWCRSPLKAVEPHALWAELAALNEER